LHQPADEDLARVGVDRLAAEDRVVVSRPTPVITLIRRKPSAFVLVVLL
jgi:hypothetical protein